MMSFEMIRIPEEPDENLNKSAGLLYDASNLIDINI